MRARHALIVVLPLVLLVGCAESGLEELEQWMREQRNITKPSVAPLPEPKKFVPQPYIQTAAVEPFSNQRLLQALRQQSNSVTSNAALVEPELNRRKEPLEAIPLDAMQMVGSIEKGKQRIALLKVDNLIYQVRPGNYIGQNYGRIQKITETEIVLREIVQDATGEWMERPATLQLQERSK
ncbi:pilus assembly protein PilP [Tibeticola sp.]|uniref:pilus assembly protein PilP n=1 Tax=Tibeticola sp. TaxID=2005368 RepID=UPI0025E53CFD|nr:pilus assembly protein PilP [Tibeticola sp.]